MKAPSLALVGFCLSVAATSSVRAQGAPPTAAPAAEPAAGASAAGASDDRRGFELMLRPGYGSAGDSSPILFSRTTPSGVGDIYDGTAKPYGGGFAGDVSTGYRFLQFMSAGIYAEMRSSSADKVNDGTTDLSRSAWGAGMYVRGYLPTLHEKFDPWLSLGVGYVQDKQTYKRPYQGQNIDWTLRHHGVAVPIGIGVDYRVAPIFAIGPSFRYAIVNQAGGCLEASQNTSVGAVGNKQCTDAKELQRITKAEGYGAWSIGLDLRLTLH